MQIDNMIHEIDLSKLDCFYADVRLEQESGCEIGFKNGKLEHFAPVDSLGAFLRVYNRGRWFYKAITELDQIKAGFDELIAQSRVWGSTEQCLDIFDLVPKGHEEILRFTDKDPSKVSLLEKRALCESYFGVGEGVSELKESKLFYKDRYQKRAFKSSRGRSFVYDYADYGLFQFFTLREGDFLFDDGFQWWSEDVTGLQNRLSEAQAFLQESRRHLKASTVKPGKYAVVLDSQVVGVFTHESFGHKSEADAMMGDEAARAEWRIGAKVAAECVSIVDSGKEPNNSGYCPIDDEGMPATKTYLIKNGILQGRLHSLLTAFEFGEAPTGNARAIDFEFEPIVRMTNTYVEEGTHSHEDLIGSVKEGIFISSYRHGSGLSTFTIAPMRSYWIRDGKIAEPVRVPVISGTVFETLNRISAVSARTTISSKVFGGFGKNEQAPLRVGAGGPMILVDEMQVG